MCKVRRLVRIQPVVNAIDSMRTGGTLFPFIIKVKKLLGCCDWPRPRRNLCDFGAPAAKRTSQRCRRGSGEQKVARRETSGSMGSHGSRALEARAGCLRAPPVRELKLNALSRGFTSGYLLRAAPLRRGNHSCQPGVHIAWRPYEMPCKFCRPVTFNWKRSTKRTVEKHLRLVQL